MIRLRKRAVPDILAQKSQEWTNVLLAKFTSGQKPSKSELSRYNHADIKSALVAETHGKCAYCESKFQHVTFGDIDHVVPKSRAPEKRYSWDNLTVACDICNSKKSDRDDLLDPYNVDPDEHLSFEGPLVWPYPHSALGVRTEVALELNRINLLERRKERLQSLHRLLQILVRVNPQDREVLRRDLEERELSDDQEFAAMSRTVVRRQLAILDKHEQAKLAVGMDTSDA